MEINITYIIISLVISVIIAFYQYLYKSKKYKFKATLFLLKSVTIFLLILLLINPLIKTTETINEKPILNILVDNSSSIQYFKESKLVGNIYSTLSENDKLNEKFKIQSFQFGSDLKLLDSLTYAENNTNIYNALKSIRKLNSNKTSPIILISDGNQTIGTDYEFTESKYPIYPILVGDTTKYVDLKINQLNINKYNFLKNRFPVEILLTYEGKDEIKTQFQIKQKGKILFSKNVSFSEEKKSEIIQTDLIEKTEGIKFYNAIIKPIENEKNIKNNTKTFSVNVINEQTKVLILSSLLHPDVGALKKAIETNKQNSVDIKIIGNNNIQVSDYELVITYQPNNKFKDTFKDLNNKNRNYLLISGLHTDWKFLNSEKIGFYKKAIDQKENYLATYNPNYIPFLQKDIGFNSFPPLVNQFGETTFSSNHQILLHQNINGFETKEPLISTFTNEKQKIGLILGENIWKWRSTTFLNSNSFKDFDSFINNLVQYLSSNKKRSRLEVNIESLYNANSNINISAFYTDENYKFDPRANLEIEIINKKTNKVLKRPFSLGKLSYQTNLEDLLPGEYDYIVKVIRLNISKRGSFTISNYNIEEQFNNANFSKLESLAKKTNGKLYHKNDINSIISDLISNKTYYTIQKQSFKEKQLIDWKWILFLIVISLTTEWYIRKYLGKI